MKKVVQIILAIGILVLAYFLYESIAEPIRFRKEKEKRYNAIIQNLKDIRKAQLAYKDVHGRFTSSFDTLINFVKYDSLPLVRALGTLPDTLTEKMALDAGLILTELPEGMTDEEALSQGYLIRDTIKVSVADSIFKEGYSIDSLRYIPYVGDKTEFYMKAGEVETGSGVTVQTFLAKDIKPFDKWDTLHVGSLTEATNLAGNWE